MVINEKQIAEYMKLFESKKESYIKFVYEEIKDVNDTLVALWKVARAAKKWVNAAPGAWAADAEAELVEALNVLE